MAKKYKNFVKASFNDTTAGGGTLVNFTAGLIDGGILAIAAKHISNEETTLSSKIYVGAIAAFQLATVHLAMPAKQYKLYKDFRKIDLVYFKECKRRGIDYKRAKRSAPSV